jgi:hypothetical protein
MRRRRAWCLAAVLACVPLALGCTVGRTFARTFSPHGHLDYRIEYRPDRVCVPVDHLPHAITACVRALELLGGGVIEVHRR